MKVKNLFFICIIVVIYVASGVFLAEDFYQKEVKRIAKQRNEEVKVEVNSLPVSQEPLDRTETEKKQAVEKKETSTAEKKEEVDKGSISENTTEITEAVTEKTQGSAQKEVIASVSENTGSGEAVGREYFSDALFVGDSRTVGLKEYGDMKGAVFFAQSGMSVFDLWKKKLSVFSETKESFEEVLGRKSYGKIYLMLGINEVGYELGQIQKKYQEALEKIREMQPEAIVYLCANLHITKEHSDKDEIINNENLNRVNQMICGQADNQRSFYLDVNPVFDDESGSLSKEYASDAFHIYGKYYIKWADWLCTQAVEEEKRIE